jgi:hypothetical protein
LYSSVSGFNPHGWNKEKVTGESIFMSGKVTLMACAFYYALVAVQNMKIIIVTLNTIVLKSTTSEYL